MENENPTFWEKCKFLAPSAFITWLLIFGVSLAINHDKWWLNATITFCMVLLATISMTTWEGEEYDPDRMP